MRLDEAMEQRLWATVRDGTRLRAGMVGRGALAGWPSYLASRLAAWINEVQRRAGR